jgi:tetratricopeptide (TPR) repeat protein
MRRLDLPVFTALLPGRSSFPVDEWIKFVPIIDQAGRTMPARHLRGRHVMSSGVLQRALPAIAAAWVAGLCCLGVSAPAGALQGEASRAEKLDLLSRYEQAIAEGDQVAAIGHVLEFSEATFGEHDPATVRLTHRYGHVLYENGEYRKATEVLKTALERSTAVFGESGGEAFQINMNLAYALSQWSPSLSNRTRYFDRALEILREQGEHKTIRYMTTLINITVNLMQDSGLRGEYSANVGEYFDRLEDGDYFASMEHEYRNYFHIAEKYVLEAVELADELQLVDEYIVSKIAILQAKLNVMETADLAAVPMGVEGYISGGTERKRYDREEDRLVTAIDKLSADRAGNEIFLTVANKVRMEIAWLSKDEERMVAMCADGTLDSASEYSPDRLYEVTQDGMVVAPGLAMRISRNLFRPVRVEQDRSGKPIKKPHFIPVCIDGRLMAALSHVPRVTVEELR